MKVKIILDIKGAISGDFDYELFDNELKLEIVNMIIFNDINIALNACIHFQ